MADSPTPKPKRATSAEAPGAGSARAACRAALDAWVRRSADDSRAAPTTVAVACSGGADSLALLQTAAERWPDAVVALHVHHGLQAAADAFEAHVRGAASRWELPVRVAHVSARPAPGESPEDAARRARYRALAGLAPTGAVVLLGHHAADQSETVLLALSRGAGLPGLAAMPVGFERHGVRFARPWLGLDPAVTRAALREAGESWIDDPSNADPRFTRNRLRQHVLPGWREAFPGADAALARTAAHAAQAQRLLDALAREDLARTGAPPAIAALQTLDRDRQANALRHWLRTVHGVAPSAAQLDELLDQVAACRTRGHRLHLRVAAGHVVRDGECLSYTPSV